MSREVTKQNQKPYIVQIFLNCNKRYGIRHPSGIVHHKDWATYAYARKVCQRNDWIIDPGNHEDAA